MSFSVQLSSILVNLNTHPPDVPQTLLLARLFKSGRPSNLHAGHEAGGERHKGCAAFRRGPGARGQALGQVRALAEGAARWPAQRWPWAAPRGLPEGAARGGCPRGLPAGRHSAGRGGSGQPPRPAVRPRERPRALTGAHRAVRASRAAALLRSRKSGTGNASCSAEDSAERGEALGHVRALEVQLQEHVCSSGSQRCSRAACAGQTRGSGAGRPRVQLLPGV